MMSTNTEQRLQQQVDELMLRLTAEREARQRAEAALKASCDEHRADCLYELGISCAGTEALQRENAELKQELKDEQEIYVETNKALNHVTNENAELTRKLAEQQAVIKYAIEISESALDGKYDDHKADAHLHIVNRLKNSHNFELTKLLEEAKRQAVPKG